MPLYIIKEDITKLKVDAIVNATNQKMVPDGGVDAAIHKAAGSELMECCKKLGGVGVGEAKVTPAFNLPAKYVIHTVGPVWMGGKSGERALLRSCYTECLDIAIQKKCKSIAFPLISAGLHGYPKSKVLNEAEGVIKKFIDHHEIDVYLVVYDKSLYSVNKKLCSDVQRYIDCLSGKNTFRDVKAPSAGKLSLDLGKKTGFENSREESEGRYCCRIRKPSVYEERENRFSAIEYISKSSTPNIDEISRRLSRTEKSFAETLFYFIDKKGMTDVQAYKGANVSRKAFSKLRCEKDYKPSKATAMSYAISLRLNLDETKILLSAAGYALSHSLHMDLAIEYFLLTGEYKDIHEINQILYQFDLPSLGCEK
jgi:O-acetyl-ADP-ribose deacetylase (regulator of RNase III)